MSTLRSPNELYEAACEQMLGGQEPTTPHDWILVVNFWAANLSPEVAHQAARLMVTIFAVPLSEDEVAQIVDYQLAQHG